MTINLIDYYKALNGESSLNKGVWNINHDKRHAFSIYSDFDALDGSNEKLILSSSDSEIDTIAKFSNTLNQKIDNTKIIIKDEETEEIHLDLDDRIITIIVDQSGSMIWNDSNNFRYDLAMDLVNKVHKNYPGDVKFNLLKYGSKIIDILFFGLVKDNGEFNSSDLSSISQVLSGDESSNYTGVRISRKEGGYPTAYAGIDGEIIKDGFISRILEDGLTENTTYYYKVYTYDHNLKFSEGIKIKVTSKERNVPRGISIFKTFADTDDVTKGQPLIGYGVNKDDYILGLWHMCEGKGRYLFDFSNNKVSLMHTNEFPTWYDSFFVPSGVSGLLLNGRTDYLQAEDINNDFEMTWGVGKTEITISAWIYPYPSDLTGVIFCRGYNTTLNYIFGLESNGTLFFDNGSAIFDYSTITVEYGKWQYVSVTCDGTSIVYHINDQSETGSIAYTPYSNVNPHDIVIGSTPNGNSYFFGGITEVSVHNIIRSESYFLNQLVKNPVYDGNGIEVETEYIGIKQDNGDRLVVLEYEIPDDFNFAGGEVIIVKNEEHIPSWEEDGEIIYQELAFAGMQFVSDPSDFCLGETYYYRIFSKNSDGNISFLSDSSYLDIFIPTSEIRDYFLPLDSSIAEPIYPSYGQIITPGNKKIYLRWGQTSPLDENISKVKIYYSSDGYPVVNKNGQYNGQLVFTGSPSLSDAKFVHRNLKNEVNAYYTIINIDKYGRPSNYSVNGSQTVDFLQIMSIPSANADESTIPLIEIENIQYNLVNSNSISIGWDLPKKSPEDQIEAYFDQTVLLYSSIVDAYGIPLSEDTPIKMYISAEINREIQVIDVFEGEETIEFLDTDAYTFFVTRSSEGLVKGVLRMSTDSRIISQIQNATFTIQLKAYMPEEGYIPPHTSSKSTNPMEEYAKAITDAANEDNVTSVSSTSKNIFEYYSKPVVVYFTNPWEITLTNFGNKMVSQRCYVENSDIISGTTTLVSRNEGFNGIYMKASHPFIARAKVKYKGLPVESGSIQISVWDADSSNLCQNVSVENSSSYEGPALQISKTVFPPDGTMNLLQGVESLDSGDLIDISYVDIPLKAPSLPQAVRLFVKGKNAGYSSVKDMYILFQSILQIDLKLNDSDFNFKVDGKYVAEQQSSVIIINPDYPNYSENEYDRSLLKYPDDNTIVQWKVESVEGDRIRNIYSLDNVPITNGIYSYTRNGFARNVFFGPVQKEVNKFKEKHEITATVVYKGLTSFAKKRIEVKYDPVQDKKLLPRFLMEVDGSWKKRLDLDDYVWGGGGWRLSEAYPIWADGKHYKKMKIHRNPAIASILDFEAANCFKNCASNKGLNIFELDSKQWVTIVTGDEDIEILYGEIYEETDPSYDGEPCLRVGEYGYIENGTASFELNNKEISDITYFYIRANKSFSSSGFVANNEECNNQDNINDCLCLGKDDLIGLTECELPEWSPVIYVSGETTIFANDQPLVLTGGGGFEMGIPPCPICLLEPLSVTVKWRKVTDYYYSSQEVGTRDDYLYTIVTEVGDNDFLNESEESLIKYNSDIDIRMKLLWKGENIPDETPVYISVGDNTGNTVFLASSNVYYTQIDEDGDSYVDIKIYPRKSVDKLTTEVVEVYSVYDENGKTSRHKGVYFNLTLDAKQTEIDIPVIPNNPSIEEPGSIDEDTTFSSRTDKYDILTNQWDRLTPMEEGKGNLFGGEVDGKIYVMGGLKNNSLNISNKTLEYDILSDKWSLKKSMSIGRFAGMSFTIGADIYIIGGIFQDAEAGNALSICGYVDVYHSDTDVWERLSSMPTINAGSPSEEKTVCAFGSIQHVVINYKDYFYIVGGIKKAIININSFSIREYNNRIFRYCVNDDVWEYSGILKSDELSIYQRISPLSIFYDDKLIVFGGAIEDNKTFIYPLDDFYINIEESFTIPSNGDWIISNSGFFGGFPVAKFQSSFVRYDDSPSTDLSVYYILGGWNKESNCLDLFERITTKDSVFEYASSYDDDPSFALSSIPTAKHGAIAFFSDISGFPSIYVIGGYTFATESNHIDISFDV